MQRFVNNMKKEIFYYGSADLKSRIHGVKYEPEDGCVKAIVQVIHGMAEYVERYEAFGAFLNAQGILFAGEDHLGHGKTAAPDGYGYFCEKDQVDTVVADSYELTRQLQAQYPGVPYVVLGHSMGSFILRNYLSVHGDKIQGAIIMGTGMQPAALLRFARGLTALLGKLQGEHHPSMLINAVAFGSYCARIKPRRTVFDWLSKDEKVVERYIADPMCGFCFTVNGFKTLFALIAGAQDSEKIRRIPKNLPILLVSGAEDPVGGYGKGVEAVYEGLSAAGLSNLTLKLYEGDRHEILNETDRETVSKDIVAWICENV